MKKRWFTLIEMLIVIVIIGILAWALIPRIGSARDKANDTAREANVRSLATAMVSYGMDHGYPNEVTDTTGFNQDTIRGLSWTGSTGYNMKNFAWLANYSIPTNNLDAQPTSSDHYYYKSLNTQQHFVIYTTLSCVSESDGDCGNCDASAAAQATDISTINAMTWWNAFCYFQ